MVVALRQTKALPGRLVIVALHPTLLPSDRTLDLIPLLLGTGTAHNSKDGDVHGMAHVPARLDGEPGVRMRRHDRGGLRLLQATLALLVRDEGRDRVNDNELTRLLRYIADYVFALPTVAFFMTAIGIFILGHFLSSFVLGYRRFRGPPIWRKSIAAVRYLSYRGFHIRALRWNSASVGVLLLGLVGTLFFVCTCECDAHWAS
jgi:hypothetical protein